MYIDNFMAPDVLQETLNYIDKEGFKDHDVNGKNFHAVMPSNTLNALFNYRLQLVFGKQVEPVFSFIRKATDKKDTDWRIHADGIIMDQIPTHACVWYISETPADNELKGTAFWTHETHGQHFVGDSDEFNRMITEDAEDLSKWKLDELVTFRQNRAVIYQSNRFHSKYPNQAWSEGRIVLASFFKVL